MRSPSIRNFPTNNCILSPVTIDQGSATDNLAFAPANQALATATPLIAYRIGDTVKTIAAVANFDTSTIDVTATGASLTVATGRGCKIVFFITAAGTFSAKMGAILTAADASALANGAFAPNVGENVSIVGVLQVYNGTGSNFVFGTTAIETASMSYVFIPATYPDDKFAS